MIVQFFCIDGSEITKRNSKVLEDMGTVLDGSMGETNVNGYNILEAAALTSKYKMPVSVYSEIFYNAEKDFKSENTETFEALEFVSSHFGNTGIKLREANLPFAKVPVTQCHQLKYDNNN